MCNIDNPWQLFFLKFSASLIYRVLLCIISPTRRFLHMKTGSGWWKSLLFLIVRVGEPFSGWPLLWRIIAKPKVIRTKGLVATA
jgi:hypothetical protein